MVLIENSLYPYTTTSRQNSVFYIRRNSGKASSVQKLEGIEEAKMSKIPTSFKLAALVFLVAVCPLIRARVVGAVVMPHGNYIVAVCNTR